MTQLIRRDPFREIAALQAVMDRMFEDAFTRPQSHSVRTLGALGLALNIIEREDGFLVEAAIPGVNPDDLNISITDNTLTIQGEIKPAEDAAEGRYLLQERSFGHFSRSVTLPATVDADAVEATYENGVLKLHLPKAAAIRPHKITVHTPKMIEGQSSRVE